MKKTLIKNIRHYIEICARTFIINNVNYSKKIIFVVCKNMKNILLSIVEITKKIHFLCYDKTKKSIKKINFFNKKHNEKHNEKIKHYNS